MNLFGTMDRLMRHRPALYQMAAEGVNVGQLCLKLLLVFVLTTAVYGAVMGSFRLFHPEYFFSDFEITAPGLAPFRGKVAGLDADHRKVYTEKGTTHTLKEFERANGKAEARFNITRPSDPYPVVSVGEEKGYGVIQLAPDAVLKETDAWSQSLLVAIKTPLLFVLSLLVCYLALYLMNLAFGVGLPFTKALTPMAFGLSATGTMLGVFAPIAALFSVVTESYHFMKVMHLLIFTVAGLFGVKVLSEGLVALAPPDIVRRRLRALIFCWLLLYVVVGAQLAWTLKPFLGTPYLPETPPFRPETGNIYVSFFQSLGRLTR